MTMKVLDQHRDSPNARGLAQESAAQASPGWLPILPRYPQAKPGQIEYRGLGAQRTIGVLTKGAALAPTRILGTPIGDPLARLCCLAENRSPQSPRPSEARHAPYQILCTSWG